MGWDRLKEVFDVVVCSNYPLSGVGVKEVVEWMVIRHMGGSESTIRMKSGATWSSVIA